MFWSRDMYGYSGRGGQREGRIRGAKTPWEQDCGAWSPNGVARSGATLEEARHKDQLRTHKQ